jgi:hypothetical protein
LSSFFERDDAVTEPNKSKSSQPTGDGAKHCIDQKIGSLQQSTGIFSVQTFPPFDTKEMTNVRRNSSSVGRVISLLPLLCIVLQAFTLPSKYYIDPVRFFTSLSSAINNVEWGRKSVLQLQEELRSRGLSDKGTKTDLMQRLEALNTVKEQQQQQQQSMPKQSMPKQQGESDQTDPFIKQKSYKKNVAPPFQNQMLVDMDSDEARRIENYLKKYKQQANQNAEQQGLNGQPNPWTRDGRGEEQR